MNNRSITRWIMLAAMAAGFVIGCDQSARRFVTTQSDQPSSQPAMAAAAQSKAPPMASASPSAPPSSVAATPQRTDPALLAESTGYWEALGVPGSISFPTTVKVSAQFQHDTLASTSAQQAPAAPPVKALAPQARTERKIIPAADQAASIFGPAEPAVFKAKDERNSAAIHVTQATAPARSPSASISLVHHEEPTRPETASASTASGCLLGHAGDYAWVYGEVSRDFRNRQTWRLRYLPVSETDPYGGAFTLVQDGRLDGWKEGMCVKVWGHIVSGADRLPKSTYHVERFEVLRSE